MSALTDVEAVIVAGGRATRMGGVDKPALAVGGRRLLDTVLASVTGCARITVVGPRRDDLDPAIIQVQEQPAGAGPVAALAAASPVADVVVTLAADLPFVTAATVATLITALDADLSADAAFAVDDEDRMQYLLAVWRGPALSARLAHLGEEVADLPMKALLPDRYASVTVTGTADCDTPADLHRARIAHAPGRVASDPDDARSLVRQALLPLPARRIPVGAAEGATLAAPVVAAAALPPLPTSAMDGYAVAGDGPWTLRPEVRRAGDPAVFTLENGEAARIATGAHLPAGATAAVRDEFVRVDNGVVRRLPECPVRDDTRRRGEDWDAGFVLAESGETVTPAVLSAALSGEVTEIDVRGPLRVHLVISGDEIVRHGPLREGRTRDSLGPVLPRFVRWCGAEPVGETLLHDSPGGFEALFAGTQDVDVLVIVGATGGGAADRLRGALDRAGAHIVVERVRCKPGGSQVAAVLPDGRAVLGLPGNPVAALSTLLVMLPAVVDGRTGRTPPPRLVGPLANASEVEGDRTRLLPARQREDGQWLCDNAVRTSHLAGLIGRTAIALVPPRCSDGDVVELLPLPR